MRTLLLASAAILMTAGAAMAQSSTMSPAPTGAPNAPAATQTPGVSPGNMAPTPPKTATSTMGTGSMSSGSMGTGSMSSGSTGSSTSGSGSMAAGASDATPVSVAPHHKMTAYRSTMSPAAMPTDASADTYLHIASMAIKHHEKSTATEALGRAETVLLTRSVPQGMIQLDTSPAVMAIEHARSAVSAGDMSEAASDTRMAMTQSHSGMMGSEAGPMSSTSP